MICEISHLVTNDIFSFVGHSERSEESHRVKICHLHLNKALAL